MKFLHPWLDEKPCVNSAQGNIINYEELAQVNPELVILRVGDCTLGGSDKEKLEKTISTIENLGLNLAVIYSPTFYKKAELSSMRDEMRVLGEIFNQKDRALKTLRLLKRHTNTNTRARKKYHAKTLNFIYRLKSRRAQKRWRR